MMAAKPPVKRDVGRSESDAHRSLPRILARLLYVEELEESALNEIDKIAASIERAVRVRFLTLATIFILFSGLTFVTLVGWGLAVISGANLGYQPVKVILPLFLIATVSIGYWRYFQYGFGAPQSKRLALYRVGSKSTIETIEKLFGYLGRRTAPRAYYRTRDGSKHYLSRHIFSGRLRGLLLSEDASERSLVMPPIGFWFSGQIFIEAEPEDIINALKVKPQSKGRPKEYDYEAILLTLIEHPALRNIEPANYTVETRVMNLIRALCDPCEEHENDIPVPENTELRKFAKKILAAIEKNRVSRISLKR